MLQSPQCRSNRSPYCPVRIVGQAGFQVNKALVVKPRFCRLPGELLQTNKRAQHTQRKRQTIACRDEASCLGWQILGFGIGPLGEQPMRLLRGELVKAMFLCF